VIAPGAGELDGAAIEHQAESYVDWRSKIPDIPEARAWCLWSSSKTLAAADLGAVRLAIYRLRARRAVEAFVRRVVS
jgi:hypothetical protein